MMNALQDLAEKNGVTGWFAAEPACEPLLGVRRLDQVRDRECVEFNDAMLSLIQHHDFHHVLLIARWGIVAFGRTQQDLGRGRPQVFVSDKETSQTSLTENWAVFKRGTSRTLHALQGRQVTVLLDPPSFDADVPIRLAREANLGEIGGTVRFPLDSADASEGRLRKMFDDFKERYDFNLIGLSQSLCRNKECLVAVGGHSLYIDDNHLSSAGAAYVESALNPFFEKLGLP
jgi:hypothetical protein